MLIIQWTLGRFLMKTWKKSNPDKFGSSTEGQLHKLGLNITGQLHKFLASNVGQLLKLNFSIADWLHKFVASIADLIHQDLLPAWWPAPGSCPQAAFPHKQTKVSKEEKDFYFGFSHHETKSWSSKVRHLARPASPRSNHYHTFPKTLSHFNKLASLVPLLVTAFFL